MKLYLLKYIFQLNWVYILNPIWSLIINLIYFIINISKYNKVKNEKLYLLILPLQDVMNKFSWVADKFKDWTPYIYTLIINNYKDDCDGAATLAKFWYKNHNIKSRLVFIYDENYSQGHCVCVRNDNTEFVSNNSIVKLNPNNWKEDLLSKFDDIKYSIIIERKF